MPRHVDPSRTKLFGLLMAPLLASSACPTPPFPPLCLPQACPCASPMPLHLPRQAGTWTWGAVARSGLCWYHPFLVGVPETTDIGR